MSLKMIRELHLRFSLLLIFFSNKHKHLLHTVFSDRFPIYSLFCSRFAHRMSTTLSKRNLIHCIYITMFVCCHQVILRYNAPITIISCWALSSLHLKMQYFEEVDY